MFTLPLIAFVGGLVAMGRTKPQTVARKILCLGPRSGIVYPVEDFPEIGVIVVRSPNKAAIAQFLRVSVREPGKPGLVYQQGQGDPQLLELIRQDFAVPAQKLAAVASSPAAAALKPEERELYWSALAYRSPETLTDDQKRIVEAMKNEPHPNNPKAPAASAPRGYASSPSKASTPSGI